MCAENTRAVASTQNPGPVAIPGRWNELDIATTAVKILFMLD